MLGLHARPVVNRVVVPVGRRLASLGVTPDAITITGTVGVSAGALGFYPRGSFLWGTVFIACFVFSDLLDGAVARAQQSTGSPWGAFLDSSLDRIADAAVFGGIALWYADPHGGASMLYCAVTIYCLSAGMVISYVKARAEGLGMTCNVGLAERSERLIAILAATGLAGLFDVIELQQAVLWLLVAATTVTVGQRFTEVHRQARSAPRTPATPDTGSDAGSGTRADPEPHTAPDPAPDLEPHTDLAGPAPASRQSAKH
jgi:CDP-diacylglycerol--glycerol-3-phosphate 3-phosphatidyltransferase